MAKDVLLEALFATGSRERHLGPIHPPWVVELSVVRISVHLLGVFVL
jgi:hypothetical protein